MEKQLKNIFIALILLLSSLHAAVSAEYSSQKVLDSKIPIVDIRTKGEWVETGLAQGAIPIMFFNEQGGYNIEAFIKELNAKVDTKKPFALICRTGSRTKIVSNYLSAELGYQVTDLQGGMVYYKSLNLPVVPYK